MFHGALLLRSRTEDSGPPRGVWSDGPLPIRIPGTADRVTDAPTRSTYYDRRAAQALYGIGSDAQREHRFENTPIREGSLLKVCAIERIRVQSLGDDWLNIVHVVGSDADIGRVLGEWEMLSRWKRSEDRKGAMQELLRSITHDPGLDILAADSDPYHVALLSEPPPEDEVRDLDHWLLAAAIASESAVADLSRSEKERLLDGRIEVSADWSALVLRDGAALVAHPRPDSEFVRRFGPVYFQSIYVDAFVLGRLQQLGLRNLTDDLVDLRDPSRHPRRIERLAARMNRFRNELWWQHLTEHGVANELLVAMHRQHRIPELLEQVRSELGDYMEQASLRASRVLNLLAALFAVAGMVGAAVEVYRLAVVDDALPGPLAIASISVTLVLVAAALVMIASGRTPRSWTRARR